MRTWPEGPSQQSLGQRPRFETHFIPDLSIVAPQPQVAAPTTDHPHTRQPIEPATPVSYTHGSYRIFATARPLGVPPIPSCHVSVMGMQHIQRRQSARIVCLILLALAHLSGRSIADPANRTANLHIEIIDDDEPVPCRIHIHNQDGQPHAPPDLPFWHDHFVCDGRAALSLEPGIYRYEIERGPEYKRATGSIEVKPNELTKFEVSIDRIAHLRSSGWYSGDLHVHRPPHEVPLLMRAEDLDIAPVITWWNNNNAWDGAEIPEQSLTQFDGNRFYDVMAGEDEREAGALLYFGLDQPLDIKTDSREFPSPMTFLAAARQANPAVWIDIEKPFWWDVPLWLASGRLNSIGIANNHMCRSRMYENEAWGRPRDEQRLPPPRGNGYWTQEIYYHALNCGFRIPPSAGSASGVLPNPVGYNRVYVHLEDELTWSKWWDGLRAGRSFVTNGPLLTCRANRKLPGHVLESPTSPVEIEIDVSLITQDPVSSIEIIVNGDVVETIQTTDDQEQSHQTNVTLTETGWLLVRCITDREETFRFASTAPWFVEIGGVKHQVSRRSAEFFAEWAEDRARRVRETLTDPDQIRDVLPHHEEAIRYWQEQITRANAN